MKYFHARRLMKLAKFLRTIKRSSFDISSWCENAGDAKGCGTVACAAGWACKIPSFNKIGYVFSSNNEPKFNAVLKSDKCAYDSTRCYLGWCAPKKFFGLSQAEAMSVFHQDGYRTKNGYRDNVTPKLVARKIELLVKNYYPQLLEV